MFVRKDGLCFDNGAEEDLPRDFMLGKGCGLAAQTLVDGR